MVRSRNGPITQASLNQSISMVRGPRRPACVIITTEPPSGPGSIIPPYAGSLCERIFKSELSQVRYTTATHSSNLCFRFVYKRWSGDTAWTFICSWLFVGSGVQKSSTGLRKAGEPVIGTSETLILWIAIIIENNLTSLIVYTVRGVTRQLNLRISSNITLH